MQFLKRCVFCKADSSSSKSREHIVPESLGNTSEPLPLGIVCDRCNNYFARKIEQPVLESEFFKNKRSQQVIPNKGKKLPVIGGTLGAETEVQLTRDLDGQIQVQVPTEQFQKILNGEGENFIVIPMSGPMPNKLVFSRFLAKMAIEGLAQRLLGKHDLIARFIDDTQFDELRNHARSGEGALWPFHERSVYAENFSHEDKDNCIVLHSYDFIYTNVDREAVRKKEFFYSELYFTFTLFGVEYALNMGGRSTDGYVTWLEQAPKE